jgi:phenylacetate-CoA ligase
MKLLTRFLELLRYIAFWTIDLLKGGKVYRHYNQISFLLEHYSNPKAIAKRQDLLQNILNNATNTTPFYKKYRTFETLNDFPVIDKNTFRDNFNEFKSEKFLYKKVKKIITSGSTGVTMIVNQDANKKLRNSADNIYFSKLAGFKIGYKLIFLRHWDFYIRKSTFSNWIHNIQEEEVFNLNEQYINNLIISLNNNNSRLSLMGYPSSLDQIFTYLESINSEPLVINFKSLITISESLNDYTRKNIKKYFNINAVSRYSNSENGIIAQETINNNKGFAINWASYYVEILDFHEDIPAKKGEIGRIIITDLFNYAMPMIRYDTGDIGQIDYDVQPPIFKKIEGRKGDVILNTKGEIITYFIVLNLCYYNELKQGQLIQESQKNYTLKLNVTENFTFESKIINEFKGYLGDDAVIKIEYVDEIPILSSGKRRLTINNYLK